MAVAAVGVELGGLAAVACTQHVVIHDYAVVSADRCMRDTMHDLMPDEGYMMVDVPLDTHSSH